MGRYLLLLIISFQSCKSQYLFKDVKSYVNFEATETVNDGFIGIDESFYSNETTYKRYLLKMNNKIVIDGYWAIINRDTISFIDYSSNKKECKNNKLIFFVRDKTGSYFLGRSCEDEFHYPTDVLVENKGDSLIENVKYFKFNHSIISIDDYNDNSDAIVANRRFLINFKRGLILDKEYSSDYSPYWFNY